VRTWFKLVAWMLGLLGAVCGALYAFVFDVWTVPNDDPMEAASIEPTLSAGDVVILSRHTTVRRGNLVRCADPQAAPGRFVVARAIAPGGETVELHGEIVTVDGHRTPSPRACDTPTVVVRDPQSEEDVTLRCAVEEYGDREFWTLTATDHPEPPTKVRVEKDLWYLLSDDRHVHVDSRDFGAVDPATCEHVVFRLVGGAGFGDATKRLSIVW
jgi:signal peptidase I